MLVAMKIPMLPQDVIAAFEEIMKPENAERYFKRTPEKVMVNVSSKGWELANVTVNVVLLPTDEAV